MYEKKQKKMSVRDMCFIGIATAMICVLGQISIPMPYGVPMTLQTFAIPLAGVILGAKRGTIATVLYLLLGAVGLPVFSGFSGGFSIIVGPTGGFILSFPIMALLAGIGSDIGRAFWLRAGLIVGAVVNYICGMFMFALVTSSSLKVAFTVCVLPFIPTAMIKIITVEILGVRMKTILIKGNVLL